MYIHVTTHAQLHVIGQGEARKKQTDRILEKLELGKMAAELSKAIIKTSNNADPFPRPFWWPSSSSYLCFLFVLSVAPAENAHHAWAASKSRKGPAVLL